MRAEVVVGCRDRRPPVAAVLPSPVGGGRHARRLRGWKPFRLAMACGLAVTAACIAGGSRATAEPPPLAPVTRADLGFAYLRLEQTYFANPPTDVARIAQINQAFDAATKQFFSGKFAETIAAVNQLTAALQDGPAADSQAVALSIKPVVEPPVVALDRTATLTLGLSSIYAVEVPDDTTFEIALRPAGESEWSLRQTIQFESHSDGRLAATVTLDGLKQLAPGAYDLVVVGSDAALATVGMVNVVPQSLDEVRQQNDSRLAALATEQPELQAAIAACRSRNALLQDQPSTENSSQFLSDLAELAEAVEEEIRAIAGGADPYHRRPGDYWRTIDTGEPDTSIPLRIYAPQQAVGEQPVPLVITLHGAGGDENMFFAGYGAGRIKDLADEHGFLVASPATRSLAGKPERFDALVQELADDYAIDPQAIYVLGHSMGGFATITLASKRADRIAAACCLAGGGNPGNTTLAPTLIIAGKLDSVVPAIALQTGAKQAQQAGLPVEFRLQEHYGHTLLVGAVLPEAVNWLLGR